MRIRPTGFRRRGSFMLGFAGLIVFLAVLCGSILLSSLETYRTSAFHLWRLQSRAAAEGMAVALSRASGVTTEPLTLGDAVVTPGAPVAPEEGTTGTLVVPFSVEVRRGGRPVYTERYSARFDAGEETTGARTRELVALEVVR